MLVPAGPDADLYHLPKQAWLAAHGLAPGVLQVNSRFGFESVLDWLEVWSGPAAWLLFPAGFLLFLVWVSRCRGMRAIACAAGLGALISHGYLVVGYTSADTAEGLMFAITFLYGLKLLWEQAGTRHITLFFSMAVLTFMLKASGAVIFLWVVYVCWRIGRLHALPWLGVAVMPWLSIGVVESDCLVYPVAWTCGDAASTALAVHEMAWVKAWARDPAMELTALEGWGWLSDWWAQYGWFFGFEVIMCVCVALMVGRATPRSIKVPATVFIAIALVVWFISAPALRFGAGPFLCLPVVAALWVNRRRNILLVPVVIALGWWGEHRDCVNCLVPVGDGARLLCDGWGGVGRWKVEGLPQCHVVEP